MATDDAWDIVGFGVAAVDDVFYTETFPAPGEKAFFDRYIRVGGGQTATAMVAAARLGCRCFYAGHLGDNDLSRIVREIFARENIGCRERVEHPRAMPTHTLVLVKSDSGERSNLANLSRVHQAEIGGFERNLIVRAKCLLVDQSVPQCQFRAAEAARAAGVPVVGDLEAIPAGRAQQAYPLIDHLIVPLDVALRDLDASGPEEAVRKMLRDGDRAMACVTDGVNGAWYAAANAPDSVLHQSAFTMTNVVDTNGCGDVFHGAYATALVRGLPLAERIRRAAAAAAIKTQKPGGQTGAPTDKELENFLSGS